MRILLITLLLLTGLLACNREEKQQPVHFASVNSFYAKYGCERPVTNPASVSIEMLVKSPAAYEGKPVRVEGFYFSSFEHSAIYPNPQDGENDNTRNGLWVLDGLPNELSGERVTLEGIFTSGVKGHIGQWPASLCNVTVR